MLVRPGCIHDMANFKHVWVEQEFHKTLPLSSAVYSTDTTLLHHALPFEHNPLLTCYVRDLIDHLYWARYLLTLLHVGIWTKYQRTTLA